MEKDGDSLINFNKIIKISEGDNGTVVGLTNSYIDMLEEFMCDYQETLAKLDVEKFRLITHKLKGSIRYLEVKHLEDAINKFRVELYEGSVTPQMVEESKEEVLGLCRRILDELQQKIALYKDWSLSIFAVSF